MLGECKRDLVLNPLRFLNRMSSEVAWLLLTWNLYTWHVEKSKENKKYIKGGRFDVDWVGTKV